MDWFGITVFLLGAHVCYAMGRLMALSVYILTYFILLGITYLYMI